MADNTYAGNSLDNFLNNTWYNGGTYGGVTFPGLTPTAKAAIVDKTFTQDSWNLDSTAPSYVGKYKSGNNEATYNIKLANAQYESAITRHVYALSVQDVLDYLGASISDTSSNTKLTYTNIWQMFWNSSTSQNDLIWFSSASAGYSRDAMSVVGVYGYVGYGNADIYGYSVRPAFKIDLSKISWSKTT